ncbi:MAG TPA: hypothetical protein VFR58_13040 [Flavisolibacter sp.]|nr:hypothetical protein [Flavisolibacter sp.]
MAINKDLRIIRRLLAFFMAALFLSGATAIPVDAELSLLLKWVSKDGFLYPWLQKVLVAYRDVQEKHPFLLYGYDWLAFAHFVLAILFIGPYRDPVKNIWVLEFGLIACVLVLPLAFIAGAFRGIPLGWQLIDCAFGIIGFIPLWICRVRTLRLAAMKNHSTAILRNSTYKPVL